MGINMQYVKYLDRQRVFHPGMKILDIGSSNLYSAASEDISAFIRKYNPQAQAVDKIAARLAEGSTYVPGVGGSNKAFAGELFEAAGFEYLSFDIADGYKTYIFDMNRQQLPAPYQKHFDLVVNFGTTEHIIHQLNCFKTIHDATRSGGYIYHQLPAVGYANHGYFTYTGRFFFDLASGNEYSIIDFSYGEPGDLTNLFAGVSDYSGYFPGLLEYLRLQQCKGEASQLNTVKIPDIPINVLYQKVCDKPFFASVETSTSVGAIAQEVFAREEAQLCKRTHGALAGIKSILHDLVCR